MYLLSKDVVKLLYISDLEDKTINADSQIKPNMYQIKPNKAKLTQNYFINSAIV